MPNFSPLQRDGQTHSQNNLSTLLASVGVAQSLCSTNNEHSCDLNICKEIICGKGIAVLKFMLFGCVVLMKPDCQTNNRG